MNNPIVSHAEWVEARKALLAKEKEFTKLRDQLSQQRRELPLEKVEKDYVFQGQNGPVKLSELFDGRSQLIVYHFMYGPDWEAGCPSCSFLADHFNPAVVHLNHRDVSFVAVSRAPLEILDGYKKRMEWDFRWVSSYENDFNQDYNVSFTEEEFERGDAYYNLIPRSSRIPRITANSNTSTASKGDNINVNGNRQRQPQSQSRLTKSYSRPCGVGV